MVAMTAKPISRAVNGGDDGRLALFRATEDVLELHDGVVHDETVSRAIERQ